MNRSAPISSLPYVVSLAALAAAVLVRWLMDPVLGDTLPLITLFAAIGVTVWIGGYRPALLVVGLGYAACHYLFIQPRGEFDLSNPRSRLGLFLYLATASIIIVLGEAHRRNQQRYRIGEEAARRQAELMRITLASIGDGVITTDPEGKITSMNAVAERLTGWMNAEVAGLPLTQVFRILNESTRLEVENTAIRSLKDGVIVGLANHTVLIAKDGSERPIDDSAAPIRSERGEVVGSVLVFRDISARHQAEVEQRTVQEQIAKTLESVTDGFVRYDRDWRIVYVNAEAERINRLPRSEMLGRILWEVFPALVGTKFETEFRRSVAERVTVEFENYYEPFGRWYSLKGYPMEEGGLTTFIRDITEQKVSREALERSEARLRRVFESNVVGMIQWNLDLSLILDANDTFLRMTGYTRDDLAAGRLNFRDMTPPEWTPRNEEGIHTIRANGHAAPYEKEYFRKDGTRAPLIIAGTRFDDSPSEGMSLLIDISDRKRAEQEIVRLAAESERQRRLYETVLTNTPDFVYVFSLDHKVVYANDALIKMWGRGHEGAIGKTFLEIGYEPWHAEMHDREIDQVRATRQPIRGEVPFNGTHGRRHYDYIFVPVIGADGEVEAVAGTTRDVTERWQQEERQAFLIRLADTLRPLSDPVDVQAEVSRVLGKQLGANRVAYFEVQGEDFVVERDYTDAAPSVVGRYPIASFGPEMLALYRDGRTATEADVDALSSRTRSEKDAFAAIQTRAYIGVPLVKGGVFVAGLAVHASTVREWTPTEIALTEETAERTWAAVERVRAEAALRASEESRRIALDAAELGTFNIDLTSNSLTFDERFRIIFAGSTAAMDYEQAFAVIHPDDQARVQGAVAAATRFDDPAPYAEEYRVVHPDKSVHWVLAKGRANFAGQGPQRRIVSFDGTVSDITAQKEAEMRMRESEERFRLMADAAPVMIWMSGRDKQVNWYNQPWLDFTGRTMAEAVGNGANEVVHPDDLVRTLPIYTAAFDARTPFSMEYRLRRHDGEFRWMICNGVPRCRADGEFEGYIGSCFDVTDYKNAQAALLDADRRKDEFLATLAHELRNPLAPIHNGLQILQLEGVSGTVEQARAMMERQLTQLIRLVDDLLDVSRVTSGKLALRKERVELKAIIDAAIETSRPVIDQAGHELAVVVPNEPILVDADATRIAQIVSNLLNNSAKYTRRGGHIRLTVRLEKGTAVVVVADDGIGIPPNMVGKVFEMFTQVDRALEKTTGGLGIGLSLVKGLVEMHGGTIEARSEGEGRGSEFIARLPVAVGVTQKVESAVVEQRAGSSRRLRILVADDNVDSARSLGRLLELYGNDVRTAHDGLQAVEAAEAFQPEVILLDIGMPKLNGHEVCRRIRELPWGKNAILVAMTGWGQEEDKRMSHEAGFDLHLVKPVDMAAIKKLLSSLKMERVCTAVLGPPTSE